MYDDEEDIKRKRKKLIYIIIAIVILILILLVFLLTRGSGKKKKEEKMPECSLEVKEGTLGENDIYTSATVIGFKEVTPSSSDVPITKQTVGVTDNSRNKETYTITKEGEFTVNGYIQDANGNTGTCSITVKVAPTAPTCELEVQDGIQGENGWFISDVTVGFKEKNSNSTTSNIEKYYIEEEKTEINTSEVVRSDPPKDNLDKYVVKDNQITTLVGYVIDTNGNEGKCNIKVSKDSEIPTCTLKVDSGTQDETGKYTTNVELSIDSVEDNTSGIASQGIGITKNYTEKTYTVTKDGETTVYGYVKDSAGNEGTCEMKIERPTIEPTPVPTPAPTLSCSLETVGTEIDGKYLPGAIVKFKTKTTTGTDPITSYGIDVTQKINDKDSYQITTSGSITLYGMIKDSKGNTGVCGPITVNTLPTLASKVKVGDKIGYDAGKWDSSAAVPTANGTFGGYAQGASKNANAASKCRNEDSNTETGWKVLSVSNGTVTIVHAGTPECYYHAASSSTSSAVTTLNNRAATYANAFAQSARIMNYQDYNSAPNELKVIGNHYYLATAKDNSALWYVSYTGRTNGGSSRANGIRPVIVLKNDLYTTDSTKDGYWPLYQATITKSQEDIELETPKNFVDSIKEIITNILN